MQDIAVYYVVLVSVCVMKITEEKLAKLEKLAALKLPEDKKDEFLNSFEDVVAYLHNMENVDISAEPKLQGITGNFLKPREWVSESEYAEKIMKNVEHKILGNNVTIKSFVERD